jgi:K+-sensing histidine kinase KdpD
MRTLPIMVRHWRLRQTRWGRGMRRARYGLPRAVALAIAPLMLGSCAELMETRTDTARLRSDLHANAETLSQLTARLDELERRQATMDSAARQTQQELSQAIEVLLKKALIAENRLTRIGSERPPSKSPEKLESQADQPASETQQPAAEGKTPRSTGKQLSLGMTQEEVRRTLGDPISVEAAGSYIFWQYSQVNNLKYVVFEKASGQVSGWRGL